MGNNERRKGGASSIGESMRGAIPGIEVSAGSEHRASEVSIDARAFSDEELSGVGERYQAILKKTCAFGGNNGRLQVLVPSTIVGGHLSRPEVREALMKTFNAADVEFVQYRGLAAQATQFLAEMMKSPSKTTDEPGRKYSVKPKDSRGTFFKNSDNLSRIFDPSRVPFMRTTSNAEAYDSIENLANSFTLQDVQHSPLLIYGITDEGKTHMLQYLAHRINVSGSGRKIRITSGRGLERENTKHCGESGDLFNIYHNARKKWYDGLDALLIDDVDYLAEGNKRSTVSWISGVVENLIQQGKMVVSVTGKNPVHTQRNLEYECSSLKGEDKKCADSKTLAVVDHKSALKRLFGQLASGKIIEVYALEQVAKIPFMIEYFEQFSKLNEMENGFADLGREHLSNVRFAERVRGYSQATQIARQVCDDALLARRLKKPFDARASFERNFAHYTQEYLF